MGQTNFDISMSLDGYITAAGQTAEAPLGQGGERLHEWAFGGDERDRAVLEDGVAGTGAVITGRRNYEHSLPWWGPGGPTGEAALPVIVVSHSVPSDAPEGGVYEFVTDGIEAALDRAREAAGAKDVTVMGGADTGQQYLRAGLIDRVSIHLVPVIFGGGTRMFDNLGDDQPRLECTGSIQTDRATHLRYRVVR